METPDWLSDITLITFDCFGTLLNWRSGLNKVEISSDEDFKAFEETCLSMMEGDRHVPYTQVLIQSIRKLRPKIRPAIIGLFADDFGRLPPFPDSAAALASLQEMVKVGVLSNCDANHQLDVISTLRVAWDVCITSQEIRAYKPSVRAWDAILRMGVARTAAPRNHWLHVSAFQHYDLSPAHARGLRTCHILRPGGDDKASADLTVSSLDELVKIVADAKKGPILLEIFNRTEDTQLRDKLSQWLVTERLPTIRAIPGVRDARVIAHDDGDVVEHYTFGGHNEYQNYKETFEAEHRLELKAAFGSKVTRETRTAVVKGRA